MATSLWFSFPADEVATVSCLDSKNSREHWEKEFNARYIQPVLGKLDDKLNAAMDIIADDKQSKKIY